MQDCEKDERAGILTLADKLRNFFCARALF